MKKIRGERLLGRCIDGKFICFCCLEPEETVEAYFDRQVYARNFGREEKLCCDRCKKDQEVKLMNETMMDKNDNTDIVGCAVVCPACKNILYAGSHSYAGSLANEYWEAHKNFKKLTAQLKKTASLRAIQRIFNHGLMCKAVMALGVMSELYECCPEYPTPEPHDGVLVFLHAGTITKYQVELVQLDWYSVSEKLVENGWADRELSTMVRLKTDWEAKQDDMAKIFGEDFPKLLRVLRESSYGWERYKRFYESRKV